MQPAHSIHTHIQRWLPQICIFFLYAFILVEIIDFAYAFGMAVLSPEKDGYRLILAADEVPRFGSVFLTILISLELVETLRGYLHSHSIRIQLILLVGITAITRHLLAADLKHADAPLNFSLAALIIALAAAYFLIGRTKAPETQTPSAAPDPAQTKIPGI